MLHAVSPPRHTHDCQQLTATVRQTSTVNRCVAGSSYGCNVTEQGPLLWLARGCRGTIDCGPHHHRRVTCGDWRAWERTYTCGCGGARADSGATPATAPSRQADQTGGGRARGTGRKNQTQPRHQRHAATGNASEPAPVPADVRHLRFVEENETTVPVQRVVFIRSPTGIGDNLNGLVSGYWLSKALGANFSVCWPEIANTNVTWRIPTVIERECLEPKRRFEWLASELVLHASELAPRHSQFTHNTSCGRQCRCASSSSATTRCSTFTRALRIKCGANFPPNAGRGCACGRPCTCRQIAALPASSTASANTHRKLAGVVSWRVRCFVGRPSKHSVQRSGTYLNSNPLRGMCACTSAWVNRRGTCGPLGVTMALICESLRKGDAASVPTRLFSDLGSAHLSQDLQHKWRTDEAHAPNGNKLDARDWQSWLQLAQCSRIYLPLSLFSLTAAAASGSTQVYLLKHSCNRTADVTQARCEDAYEEARFEKPQLIGFP